MPRILVLQTAFAGDLILTLPLVQEARRLFPGASLEVLCIPSTADLLVGHPAIDRIIAYDKRGHDTMRSMIGRLRNARYDVCLTPHRSFRSALLARASGSPLRVTFDRSAAARLSTHRVRYRPDAHEIERNLDLLSALHEGVDYSCRPRLYPSEQATERVRDLRRNAFASAPVLCIAPGSVWATKRWTPEGFATVARELARDAGILLIGGPADRALCESVRDASGSSGVLSVAGSLSLLESAALIGESSLLISNDSAPVHLASAMGCPVVEVYGATSPAYGFTPFGVPHEIVERGGLACKPCAIHGGDACPIRTFACMKELPPDAVIGAARRLLSR